MITKIFGIDNAKVVRPTAAKNAYKKIPMPWPNETQMPATRPKLRVTFNTTKMLGPGETAPSKQISKSDNQSDRVIKTTL